jgi:hypothetical protein
MFSCKLPSVQAVQALLLLTIGCSADNAPDSKVGGADRMDAKVSGADSAGGGASRVDSGPASVEADGGGVANGATFTMIYEQIFTKFCNADFCHGSPKPDPFFDVSTKKAAYDSLVNAPASATRKCADSGLLRVEPGAPEKSLLRLKLRTHGTPCGQQMPIGGELKPELQMLIEQWIADGAQDN